MKMPPFNTYLGTEFVRRGDGEAEMSLVLAPHHLNRRGVVHGGVLTSLLDSALGGAVISSIPEQWWCATTSLSTQFLDGVGEGKLIATGRVQRRGARVAFAAGEVRDERGRLIATATGSWHLWTHKPGQRDDGPPRPHVKLWTGELLQVGKIMAIGRNYAAHVAEMGAPRGGPPIVFLKPATALIHDGDRIRLPEGAGEVHHEVELVAVIGRSCKGISAEDALDHVLGYAVGLDMTLREVQGRAKKRGEPWSLSKGFDGSAPISSVVRREEIGDGSGLAIRLEINGEVRQEGDTSLMLRSVAELVSYASTWITLERGDLIYTGTPEGVGAVHPGDRLEATIDRIGRLRVSVD